MKTVFGMMAALTLITLLGEVAYADDSLASMGEGDASRREDLATIENQPAPELQATNWINGDPITLADLKGKVVVLDFWATWCGPCIASIPHNNELAEKFKGRVVFVGVCHPRGGEKMETTVKDKGLEYLTALDSSGATIKAYHVDSFPDYYIIDPKGNLRLADCQNSKVESAIEKILAEP